MWWSGAITKTRPDLWGQRISSNEGDSGGSADCARYSLLWSEKFSTRQEKSRLRQVFKNSITSERPEA